MNGEIKMKKLLVLALALILMMAVAAAEHVCAPSGQVRLDMTERWELCSCGEKLNVTTHDWQKVGGDMAYCKVCYSEMFTQSDGRVRLVAMDEQSEPCYRCFLLPDGTVEMSEAYVNTYDADGNLSTRAVYENGVLTAEYGYTLDEYGYPEQNRSVIYQNGMKTVPEEDDYGNQAYYAVYEGDTLLFSERYENTYDEKGNVVYAKIYSNEVLTREEKRATVYVENGGYYTNMVLEEIWWWADGGYDVSKNNEKGEKVETKCYNANGELLCTLTYMYEYNGGSADVASKETALKDGKLYYEKEFVQSSMGWWYEAKTTLYGDDGSVTVRQYDENGNLME